MAQTWPASVTTEPGVAGGAAAALLLVSYASELKALRWLPQFFFFLLLYNFFLKKVVHKTFLLVHEFVDQMFCLSFFGSEIFVFLILVLIFFSQISFLFQKFLS